MISLLDLKFRSLNEYLSRINLENLLIFSGESSKDEILKIDDPHPELIADHIVDPRRQIAESLISNFPSSGTIMAFNESYEKGCIKNLSEYCPDLRMIY